MRIWHRSHRVELWNPGFNEKNRDLIGLQVWTVQAILVQLTGVRSKSKRLNLVYLIIEGDTTHSFIQVFQ